MSYENKMDRFQLEEFIQQVRQTKEDLDNLMWKICDDPVGHTEDDLHKCLNGIYYSLLIMSISCESSTKLKKKLNYWLTNFSNIKKTL